MNRKQVGLQSRTAIGKYLDECPRTCPNAVDLDISPLLKRARGSLGVASTAPYVRIDERKTEMQFALIRTLKFVAGVTLTAIFSAQSIW